MNDGNANLYDNEDGVPDRPIDLMARVAQSSYDYDRVAK